MPVLNGNVTTVVPGADEGVPAAHDVAAALVPDEAAPAALVDHDLAAELVQGASYGHGLFFVDINLRDTYLSYPGRRAGLLSKGLSFTLAAGQLCLQAPHFPSQKGRFACLLQSYNKSLSTTI